MGVIAQKDKNNLVYLDEMGMNDNEEYEYRWGEIGQNINFCKKMKLFNHVQIKVKNLGNSRKFYDSIMSILGYHMVLHIEDTVIGYGTSVHDMFEIRQASSEALLSQSVHLAFNASNIKSVDDFYLAAIQKGAKCNGAPGFRAQYEEGYYAAFVIDPDGHNIEAVYMQVYKK